MKEKEGERERDPKRRVTEIEIERRDSGQMKKRNTYKCQYGERKIERKGKQPK